MILRNLAKHACEKRFPEKLSSTRVVFLLSNSSTKVSIDSEKKLSDSFTFEISLFEVGTMNAFSDVELICGGCEWNLYAYHRVSWYWSGCRVCVSS